MIFPDSYKPHPSDANYYLYAKGWYQVTDTFSDLKVLFGAQNALEKKHVYNQDIKDKLLSLAIYHIKSYQQLAELIDDISLFGYDRCLSILSDVAVVDMPFPFENCRPDESLLPLSEDAKAMLEKEK